MQHRPLGSGLTLLSVLPARLLEAGMVEEAVYEQRRSESQACSRSRAPLPSQRSSSTNSRRGQRKIMSLQYKPQEIYHHHRAAPTELQDFPLFACAEEVPACRLCQRRLNRLPSRETLRKAFFEARKRSPDLVHSPTGGLPSRSISAHSPSSPSPPFPRARSQSRLFRYRAHRKREIVTRTMAWDWRGCRGLSRWS